MQILNATKMTAMSWSKSLTQGVIGLKHRLEEIDEKQQRVSKNTCKTTKSMWTQLMLSYITHSIALKSWFDCSNFHGVHDKNANFDWSCRNFRTVSLDRATLRNFKFGIKNDGSLIYAHIMFLMSYCHMPILYRLQNNPHI